MARTANTPPGTPSAPINLAGRHAVLVTGTDVFDFAGAASLRFLKGCGFRRPPIGHPSKVQLSKLFSASSTGSAPHLHQCTAAFSRPHPHVQLFFPRANATFAEEKKYEAFSKRARRPFRPHRPAKSHLRSPHPRRTRSIRL